MISAVIPAHNEAGEIGNLLQEFSSFDGVELIVAEDASTMGPLKSCKNLPLEIATLCLPAAAPSQGRAAL